MNETPQHGPGGNARHPKCLCGERGIRDPKYDAYFCPVSAVWIERLCEISCSICGGRPPTADYVRSEDDESRIQTEFAVQHGQRLAYDPETPGKKEGR